MAWFRQILFVLAFCVSMLPLSGCKQEEIKAPPQTPTDENVVVFKAGQVAPNFALKNFYGIETKLENYRGKLVLINFWATFCPPCISEMPAFQRLYQKYKNRGLEIVAINLDPQENIRAVVDYVKNSRLAFPILLDAELKTSKEYGVTGLPETFFVDPQGRFISVVDPVWAEDSVRLTSDYPWDAPIYSQLVEDLLKKHLPQAGQAESVKQ